MKLCSELVVIGLLMSLTIVSAKSSSNLLAQPFAEVFTKHANLQSSKTPVKEHAKLSARSDVTQHARVSPATRHQVVFATKQANLERLEAMVLDISDPSSKNFGKHMSKNKVNKLTANPTASRHILCFLELHDVKIVHRTANDEYITAEAPAGTWETLLQTEFFHFHVQGETKTSKFVRSLQYSIPEALDAHISAVFNVVDFPQVSRTHLARRDLPQADAKKVASSESTSASGAAAGADDGADDGAGALPLCLGLEGYTCPAVLNSIYDMRSNKGNNLTSQAVFASLDQSMSPSDLTYFQMSFGLPVQGISADVNDHVNDYACLFNSGNDCVEANLDIQYLMGMSQDVSTTFYYATLGETTNDWLNWITEVADMADPPKVFSISYASGEAYIAQSMADSFNTEAMKLAAMGVTIMASSGDDGAPGPAARSSGKSCGYAPQFPASCPYVTAVGGTQGPESGEEEVACQSQLGGVITSGGGFSELYSRPSWQDSQVTGYLQRVAGTAQDPPFGYNAQGRAYPDVSLLAASYLVRTYSTWSVLYGTSASSPFFAAMIAQINEQRVAAGKSTLGWINPSLYAFSNSILLNDIISGHNKCAEGADVCCAQGFSAAPGWDPVTGVGSVNFTALAETFLGLGDEPNVPTLAPTAVSSQSGQPVATPTVAPSTIPTARPTNTAGWIYASYFSGENCEGTNYLVSGEPTNTCLLTFDANQDVSGSMMYSCGSEYGTADFYSSANCDPATWLGVSTVYLGCTVESFALSDDAMAVRNSQSFVCSNNRYSEYPVYGGEYMVNSTYADTSCAGGVTSFQAYQNDVCVETLADASFLVSFPNVSIYIDSPDCSTAPYEVMVMNASVCTSAADQGSDDDDNDDGATPTPTPTPVPADDYYYYADSSVGSEVGDDDGFGSVGLSVQVSLYLAPSAEPSVRPTTAPSLSPSALPSSATPSASPTTRLPTVSPTGKSTAPPTANNLVYFSAAQVINGIDLSTFNGAYNTYSSTLKKTIAACMTNVAASNIINLVVTDPATSRVRGQATAFASTSSISTTYQVNVHDASQTYSSLSKQLSTAVSDGTFTTLLQSNGASLGAPGFQTASSNSVTTADLQSTGGGGDHKDTLSAGAIAGIVIGVLAGVALIACLLYYIQLYRPTPLDSSTNGKSPTAATATAMEVDMTPVSNPISHKETAANAV